MKAKRCDHLKNWFKMQSDTIREHRELLEAFRQRDHLRAEALMREHLQNQSATLGILVEQSKAAN